MEGAAELCGYSDCDFVEPPPTSLNCLICTFVSKDPQQLQCCGKLCCKACLTEYKKFGGLLIQCPMCRISLNTFDDRKSARDIKELKVKCALGCEWIGELQYLSEHKSKCDFCRECCPNECDDKVLFLLKDLEKHLSSDCPRRQYKCPHCETSGGYQEMTTSHLDRCSVFCPNECDDTVKVFHKHLDQHLRSDCPRRQYECPHCKESGEYREITTSHLDTCPEVTISCPNGPQCNDKVKRGMLGKHRETCQYEEVPCKYAKIGCNGRFIRKEIDKHEDKSDKKHLNLAVEKIINLEEVVNNEHRDSLGFTFAVENFPEKFDPNFSYISPPFYSHSNGYKMCVRVNCYIDSVGWIYEEVCDDDEFKCVGISVHLLKGENDGNLEWPCHAGVTVVLLNQLVDEGHHKKFVDFSQSDRLTDQEMSVEWKEELICFAELGKSKGCYRQYLKDGCLYIRVSVKTFSSYKPWLKCSQVLSPY